MANISFGYDEADIVGTMEFDNGAADLQSMGGISIDVFFEGFADNIEWADDDYDHDDGTPPLTL